MKVSRHAHNRLHAVPQIEKAFVRGFAHGFQSKSTTVTMVTNTIVIIGGGVAGTSTWYSVSKEWPGVRIFCYDNEDLLAPSRDSYKIVRVDYTNIGTMRQAIRSHEAWQQKPFSNYCKKKLRLVVYDNQTYTKIASNRKELGLPKRTVLSSKDVRERYGLEHPCHTTIVLEDDTLLVRLSDCIKDLREDCGKQRVTFINKHVDKLIYKESRFSGVVIGNGTEMYEEATVIVAAGPWSERLLKASGMPMPEPARMAKCVQIFVFSVETDVGSSIPIVSSLGKGINVIYLLFDYR
jgi:glycine/D-amino acid oxidase-like deaminating enzyme